MKKQNSPILIVDDEPDIRKMVAYQLKYLGYDIIQASNGKEAFEKALEQTPLILITDIAMPIQDGTELIVQFKASETLKDVPTIAITAIDSEVVERITNWAGADYYIRKPFDIEEFNFILGKLTEKEVISKKVAK